MGRGPSSQPPGKQSRASPHRETMAPRNTMEERMPRMSPSGISQQVMALSTVRSWPSRRQRQPRCSKIPTAVSTSERRGQLWRTVWPRHSTVAASSGSVLFFAPWMVISPQSSAGPSIRIILGTPRTVSIRYPMKRSQKGES